MSRITAALEPNQPITQEQARAARAGGPGFFQAFRAGVENDWALSDLARSVMRSASATYDPDFEITDEIVKELTDGLPPEYWKGFDSALSLSEAREIRRQNLALYANEQELARGGFSAGAARIIANIGDPVFLAASIASGGAGAATRATRLGRFAQAGLISAAADVPITALQVSVNPTRDVNDILWSAAGSFTLGGASGLAAGARLRRAVELDDVAGMGASGRNTAEGYQSPYMQRVLRDEIITANGRSYFKRAVEDADQARIVDRLIAETGLDRLDPEAAAELRSLRPEDALQRVAPRGLHSKLKHAPSGPRQPGIHVGIREVAIEELPTNISYANKPISGEAIDKNLLFHGSPQSFETFDISKSGGVVHFTNNPHRARDYAVGAGGQREASGEVFVVRDTGRDPVYRRIPGSDSWSHVADSIELPNGMSRLEPTGETLPDIPTHELQRLESDGMGSLEAPDARIYQSRLSEDAKILDYTTKEGQAEWKRIVGEADFHWQDTKIVGPGNRTRASGWFDKLRDAGYSAFRYNDDGDITTTLLDMSKVKIVGRASVNRLTRFEPPIAAGTPGTPGAEPIKEIGDLDLSRVTDAPSKWAAARLETVAKLGRSKSPSMRRLGSMLLDDRLRKADGSPARQAASGWVQSRFMGENANFSRVHNTQFAQWARDQKVRPVRRGEAWEDFNDLVGRAWRAGPDAWGDTPVGRAARHADQVVQRLGQLGQRHGIRGFDRFDVASGYVPRVWNQARTLAAVNRFGREAMEGFFKRALGEGLAEAGRELSEEGLSKLSRGFLRTVLDLGNRTSLERELAFGGSERDLLKAILRDELKEQIDDETIDAIARAVAPDDDKGLMSRARRRTPLNDKYSEAMTGLDGTTDTLSIEDLIENNAQALVQMYARQILGHAAEAEVLRAHNIGRPAESQAGTWETAVAQVERELVEAGVPRTRINDELHHLDWAHRGILGRRLGSTGEWAQTLRRVRMVNYIMDSGSFGIPALLEMSRLIAEGTFVHSLRVMPALRSIMKRAQDGRLANEEIEMLELITGLGTDRVANHVAGYGFDDVASAAEVASRRTDQTLERVSRLASEVSGLTPFTIFARRATALGIAQKMAHVARSGRSFSKARLAALGLDENDWAAITAQIKKHATMEEGYLGGGRKMLRSNWHEWDDVQAASNFAAAIRKFSARVIQDENLGDLSPFLTHDITRLLLQFRRFPVTAWANHALHAADMHDVRAFVGLTISTAAAGLGYIGRTYLASLARDDAEEFRAEHLATERVIRAAVGQSAWMSVTPAAIDPMLSIAGFDTPFFGFARYSNGAPGGAGAGGRQDPLTFFFAQNPTTQRLHNLTRGLSGLITAAASEDEEFSSQDANSIVRAAVPFQNLMGIRQVLDAATRSLPEE